MIGLLVLFVFLGFCLILGVIFYILLDLKPWRRESQLWDSKTDIGSMFHKSKNFAQQKFLNWTTWNHIKSYYMYYGLALILIGAGLAQ